MLLCKSDILNAKQKPVGMLSIFAWGFQAMSVVESYATSRRSSEHGLALGGSEFRVPVSCHAKSTWAMFSTRHRSLTATPRDRSNKFSLGHPSNVLPPRGSPGTTILHALSHSLKLAICTGMLGVLYKTGLSKGLLGKGGDCHEKDHGSGQVGSPEKLMKQRLLNNLLG